MAPCRQALCCAGLHLHSRLQIMSCTSPCKYCHAYLPCTVLCWASTPRRLFSTHKRLVSFCSLLDITEPLTNSIPYTSVCC